MNFEIAEFTLVVFPGFSRLHLRRALKFNLEKLGRPPGPNIGPGGGAGPDVAPVFKCHPVPMPFMVPKYHLRPFLGRFVCLKVLAAKKLGGGAGPIGILPLVLKRFMITLKMRLAVFLLLDLGA
jgi:hypothetical protein